MDAISNSKAVYQDQLCMAFSVGGLQCVAVYVWLCAHACVYVDVEGGTEPALHHVLDEDEDRVGGEGGDRSLLSRDATPSLQPAHNECNMQLRACATATARLGQSGRVCAS